jgi:four helix bundle protein
MPGVRRFEDLIAWQISVELRDEVYKLTASGPSSDDYKFRQQIRDAASSAPRNLAEGFERFNPREFARFANIAKGSLAETQNHLKHGLDQDYFKKADFDRVWTIACRAIGTTTNLFKYLQSRRNCEDFQPNTRRHPRNEDPRTLEP